MEPTIISPKPPLGAFFFRALRKIQHRSDAQDRYTENEDIRKGDDASRKFQKEKLRPTTQSRNPKT